MNAKPNQKTIYIHLGIWKTGTSALQKTFQTHREALKNEGILYPQSGLHPKLGGHFDLAFKQTIKYHNFKPEWFNGHINENLYENLYKEIKHENVPDILISCEEFNRYLMDNGSRFNECTDWIRYLQSHYRVKGVIYVRRHDEFIETWINHQIKLFRRDYPGNLKSTIAGLQKEIWDFRYVIDYWSNFFGRENLIVKEYDQKCKKDGIVNSFLSAIGKNINDVRYRTENESLAYNHLNLKMFVNRQYTNNDTNLNGQVGRILQLMKKDETTRYSLFTDEERHDIIEHFKDDYEYISKTYMGGKPIFQDPFVSKEKIPESIPVDQYLKFNTGLNIRILSKLESIDSLVKNQKQLIKKIDLLEKEFESLKGFGRRTYKSGIKRILRRIYEKIRSQKR